MNNETNREYDYSSLYNGATPPAPDTGYVNVGSSGTNTANTADSFDEMLEKWGEGLRTENFTANTELISAIRAATA